MLLYNAVVHFDFIHQLRRWLKFYFKMVSMPSEKALEWVQYWLLVRFLYVYTIAVTLIGCLPEMSLLLSVHCTSSFLELVFIVTHSFACNLQLTFAYILKIIITLDLLESDPIFAVPALFHFWILIFHLTFPSLSLYLCFTASV